MNIKILLIAILATLLPCDSKAIQGPHTGFSIGYILGYTSVGGKLKMGTTNNDIGGNSRTMGAFLSYGWAPSLTGIYLGSEIFLRNENIKINSQIEDYNISFKENTSYGTSTKIGYINNENLIFLKIGIVSMGKTRDDESTNKIGYLIGIGMDYAINPNWTIGGEFTHERYSSINKIISSNKVISFKPEKYTSNIRLKYTF